MILADKILSLRKKSGLSQEEFAEKMGVSRQAVSKWEGAQSVPDLDKILMMSEIFGVSTDYLLKDEIEEAETVSQPDESKNPKVSAELANEYIETKKKTSLLVALGVALCILSPLPLIILSMLKAESAGAFVGVPLIGFVFLFVAVAVAVALFMISGHRTAPYSFLEGNFDLQYGVRGIVEQKRDAYRKIYSLFNTLGVCLAVISPLPLIVVSLVSPTPLLVGMMLGALLLTVAVAVTLFVIAGTRNGAYLRLLSEGEFQAEEKEKNKKLETVGTVYWCITVGVYLAISFIFENWDSSWVVWPVAALIYAAVHAIASFMLDKRSK